MKPRCDVHNAPLRWTNLYDAWYCVAGVGDRACTAWRRDLAPPAKPRRFRPTFTTWDGREILSRGDLEKRRYEIWLRDGKRCQVERMISPGVFEKCGKYLPRLGDMELDHIVARGTGLHGRDDRDENLRASCHTCNQSRVRLHFGLSVSAAVYGPAAEGEIAVRNSAPESAE